MPLITGRQANRVNPPGADLAEFYKRAVYIPLLDHIMADLHSRFPTEMVDSVSELTCFSQSRLYRWEAQSMLTML
jgi:hypothetical protein